MDGFREDLVSAREIFAKRSLSPESLVFPRNQVNIEYLPTAAKRGFRCYRGHGRGWIGRRCEAYPPRRRHRLLRLVDNYVPLQRCLIDWDKLAAEASPLDIPASRFLRGYSRQLRWVEPLRLNRIMRELSAAARQRRIYHLWWHPSDFGAYTSENLEVLKRILERFRVLSES